MELKIHVSTETALVAEYGPLLIHAVDGAAAELGDVEIMATLLEQRLARFQVVGLVLLLEHGSPPPPPDVRRRITELSDVHGDRIVRLYGLLGLGFWARTIRQVISRFARFYGGTTAIETSIEDLAERAARELIGLDPNDVRRVCEQVREELLETRRARAG